MYSGLRFLNHPGELAERIRNHDWSGNPLGPPDVWPQALRFAINICLGSSFPTAIYWGDEFRLLYNDAWAPIPADRHPWALGRPGAEVWADIWDVVGPQLQAVMRTGEGFSTYDQLLMMERGGVPQETYWNYSFTPIRDEYGRVVGVLNQGNETTRLVLAERARKAEVDRLRELFQQSPGAVALLHGPDHVFELTNQSYLDLIGGRDVLGKTVAEALPEVVSQGFVELLDRVYETGQAHRAFATPITLIRAGGEMATRYLDFVYQPIKDAAGRTTDIFVEAHDVTDRYEAERALRKSEERLTLALAASEGVGSWDWDVVQDRVVSDRRFAELYGVDPARAAEGAPIAWFFASIHPEDRNRVEEKIRVTLEQGEPFAEEYRLVQPDGSVRWVTAQGRAVRDENGIAVRLPGVSFDITTRKIAEEAARATAEELRAATEAQAFIYALAERQRSLDTPTAIMRFTAAALGRRLKLDRVGFYRVSADRKEIQFGPCWAAGALPTLQGALDVSALGPAAAAYRAGRTIVIRDSTHDAEFGQSIIARKSGAVVGVPLLRNGEWVACLYANQATARDWSADDIAFIEAVAEISWDAVERVGAVAALRESEEKFRAIVNSIDQMIWSTRPDGYHDYFNDRWYEYTGVPHGATDGAHWNEVFHPDDRERAWARWCRSLETGEPYHIEYRLKHHSGAYRWVLGRAQPVRDEDGRITRWFGTCTDIQDIVDAREVLARSRAELEAAVEERTRQLLAAEEQLRQAQKMESIGQLTGGIAHDFNNMLAVVIGALDLMERRLARGSTDIARYVTAARDGATRAAALTQRLLAFSRQTPLAARAIDVNELVRGMIELLERTLGEAVRIETRLSPDPWIAHADPSQLENVILNLCVNARDAMPAGGTLTIATENHVVRHGDPAAAEVPPGDYIRLAVTDTGSGMAPDVAARAFEPFFTTKEVGRGTGLGLSQVFGFVRQSGGRVSIDTRLGHGTTVSLLLPRRGGTEAPAPPVRTPDAPRGRAEEVILVVEDEERVRSFSVEALRDLGYTVVHAESGRHALQLIDRGQGVTLLFTDVVMPEMTGPELARAARERIPGLKVLYTSGYTRDMMLSQEMAEGAPLLPKPFDVQQLASRVRAAIEG